MFLMFLLIKPKSLILINLFKNNFVDLQASTFVDKRYRNLAHDSFYVNQTWTISVISIQIQKSRLYIIIEDLCFSFKIIYLFLIIDVVSINKSFGVHLHFDFIRQVRPGKRCSPSSVCRTVEVHRKAVSYNSSDIYFVNRPILRTMQNFNLFHSL